MRFKGPITTILPQVSTFPILRKLWGIRNLPMLPWKNTFQVFKNPSFKGKSPSAASFFKVSTRTWDRDQNWINTRLSRNLGKASLAQSSQLCTSKVEQYSPWKKSKRKPSDHTSWLSNWSWKSRFKVSAIMRISWNFTTALTTRIICTCCLSTWVMAPSSIISKNQKFFLKFKHHKWSDRSPLESSIFMIMGLLIEISNLRILLWAAELENCVILVGQLSVTRGEGLTVVLSTMPPLRS